MVSLLNIKVFSIWQERTVKIMTFSVEGCKYLLRNYKVLTTALYSENIKEMIFALYSMKNKVSLESPGGMFPELQL